MRCGTGAALHALGGPQREARSEHLADAGTTRTHRPLQGGGFLGAECHGGGAAQAVIIFHCVALHWEDYASEESPASWTLGALRLPGAMGDQAKAAAGYRKLPFGDSPKMAIRLDKAFRGGAGTGYRLQSAWELAQAKKRAYRLKVERLVPAF